jgi:hypothetical protein
MNGFGTGPLPYPASQQDTIWEAGWGRGPVRRLASANTDNMWIR